ncbi:MAG: integration host factor subunit alpha [Ottowia sp.]
MARKKKRPVALVIGDMSPVTLTKADLIETLFEQIGLNKRESADVVDAFFGTISRALASGDDVKLPGFGNFEVKHKTARPGRNPRTGEEVMIPARRVVTFRASQILKDKIQAPSPPPA